MFRLRIKLPSITNIGKHHMYHCPIRPNNSCRGLYKAYQTWKTLRLQGLFVSSIYGDKSTIRDEGTTALYTACHCLNCLHCLNNSMYAYKYCYCNGRLDCYDYQRTCGVNKRIQFWCIKSQSTTIEIVPYFILFLWNKFFTQFQLFESIRISKWLTKKKDRKHNK